MYLVYNLVLWLATPLLLVWAAWRAMRGRLAGLKERLGWLRWPGFSSDTPRVWIHAVSFGEVKSAAALIEELTARDPETRIVLSASTRTGWDAARAMLPAASPVLFPPWDFRLVCRRFLRRIRPDVVVVLETELWPNLFRECKRFGAALLIANGRISDRTLPRYRATRLLWRKVLAFPDRIFAQSENDAERFRLIGARADKVREAPNLKFSVRPARPAVVDLLRKRLAGPVLVAGSTMPGEEPYILDVFGRLRAEFPGLFLILAPRHPERFAEVAGQVQAAGLPYQLRSQWTPDEETNSPGVLILDSMGELGGIYEIATIAFVGGTLVPTGGHNILEPACFARPIIIGPSMANFQQIAGEFLADAGLGEIPGCRARAGAVIQVPDHASLLPVFRFLLQNPAYCERLGGAAYERCQKNASGAQFIVDEIAALIRQRRALLHGPVAALKGEIVAAGKMN